MSKILIQRLGFAFLFMLLFFHGVASGAGDRPPVVVASLKPLHSWLCTLMEGRGSPLLLLEGKVSPHTAALRPQEMKRVKEAGLVVWIGPSFEVPLTKLMHSIPAEKVLTLEKMTQLDWLPQRGSHSHAEEDHHHHLSFLDGHIWLDPVRGQSMIPLLVNRLSAHDPSGRALYEKNGQRLLASLKKIHEQLLNRLSPLRGKPFFVMHDAYQYLEKRYGLSHQGVILLSPEHPPSGKHLQEIQQRLQTTKNACVFYEPQFQRSSVIPFLERLGVRQGMLDPLGASLPEGPLFYGQLMENIAQGLEGCL